MYCTQMTMEQHGNQSPKHEDMENKRLAHSQQHFSQAHGTPYTTAPLKDLLQYNGLTKFGNQVLSGNLPDNLDVSPTTQLLLKHQVPPNKDTPTPSSSKESWQGSKVAQKDSHVPIW